MKLRTLLAVALPSFVVAFAVTGRVDDRGSFRVGTAEHVEASDSLARCVRRSAPEWGACEGSPDGVKFELTNVCDVPVRIHWCVREANERMRCAVSSHVSPGNAARAQSCQAKRPAEVRFEVCEAGGACRVRTD